MSTPELSVVVASVNGLPYVADCLAALERNAPGAEVTYVIGDASSARPDQTVAGAVSDGGKAGFAVQIALVKEDVERK